MTKGQIACTLTHQFWFDGDTLSGVAAWYPYKGDDSYYIHPTMGVVGGFSYKLVSWTDKFVVKCEDTWDFNSSGCWSGYVIPLPHFLLNKSELRILINILKRAGAPLQVEECNDGQEYIGINESWLSEFNSSHYFKTAWEVELPNKLSCPINSPLKQKWEEQSLPKKKKVQI